jgi:predicted nucleotidyltransferase
MVASDATILAAVEALRRAAPQARIIVFGSRGRGDSRQDSDLDLLVIEPRLASVGQETSRLRLALGDLAVPVDLLVTSQAEFDYWRDTPNTLAYEAAREGKCFEPLG